MISFHSHWPDCNWCTGPRTHLGTGGNATGSDGEDPSESPDSEDDPDNDDPDVDDQPDDDSTAEDGSDTNAALPNLPLPSETAVSLITPATRIIKRVRRGVMHDVDFQQETLIPSLIPTDLPSTNDLPISDQTSSSMDRVMTQSPNAAEDPVKGGHKSSAKNSPASSTSSKKGSPTQKAHGSDACTPSPTKSLAPSASTFSNFCFFVHCLICFPSSVDDLSLRRSRRANQSRHPSSKRRE